MSLIYIIIIWAFSPSLLSTISCLSISHCFLIQSLHFYPFFCLNFKRNLFQNVCKIKETITNKIVIMLNIRVLHSLPIFASTFIFICRTRNRGDSNLLLNQKIFEEKFEWNRESCTAVPARSFWPNSITKRIRWIFISISVDEVSVINLKKDESRKLGKKKSKFGLEMKVNNILFFFISSFVSVI